MNETTNDIDISVTDKNLISIYFENKKPVFKTKKVFRLYDNVTYYIIPTSDVNKVDFKSLDPDAQRNIKNKAGYDISVLYNIDACVIRYLPPNDYSIAVDVSVSLNAVLRLELEKHIKANKTLKGFIFKVIQYPPQDNKKYKEYYIEGYSDTDGKIKNAILEQLT